MEWSQRLLLPRPVYLQATGLMKVRHAPFSSDAFALTVVAVGSIRAQDRIDVCLIARTATNPLFVRARCQAARSAASGRGDEGVGRALEDGEPGGVYEPGEQGASAVVGGRYRWGVSGRSTSQRAPMRMPASTPARSPLRSACRPRSRAPILVAAARTGRAVRRVGDRCMNVIDVRTRRVEEWTRVRVACRRTKAAFVERLQRSGVLCHGDAPGSRRRGTRDFGVLRARMETGSVSDREGSA